MTIPNEISHEEIMNLEPVSEAYMCAHSVKIGKKRLTFTDKQGRTSIRFERGVAGTGRSDFTVCVAEEVTITERCSMGHDHKTGKKSTQWGYIQMSWEQAEALMEWFQSGDWKSVREASKREKEQFEQFKRVNQ